MHDEVKAFAGFEAGGAGLTPPRRGASIAACPARC